MHRSAVQARYGAKPARPVPRPAASGRSTDLSLALRARPRRPLPVDGVGAAAGAPRKLCAGDASAVIQSCRSPAPAPQPASPPPWGGLQPWRGALQPTHRQDVHGGGEGRAYKGMRMCPIEFRTQRRWRSCCCATHAAGASATSIWAVVQHSTLDYAALSVCPEAAAAGGAPAPAAAGHVTAGQRPSSRVRAQPRGPP